MADGQGVSTRGRRISPGRYALRRCRGPGAAKASHRVLRIARLFTIGLLASAPGTAPAQAQAHVQESDRHRLQANIVAANTLPEISARAHGIDPDPDRAVLNVVVLRGPQGTGETVRAEVEASYTVLAGVERGIDMREVVANDRVSYIGTFPIPGERTELTMHVVARPLDGGEPLELSFRDVVMIVPGR